VVSTYDNPADSGYLEKQGSRGAPKLELLDYPLRRVGGYYDMIKNFLSDILHTIGQGLLNPCMVVLLLMIVTTIWQIGDLLVEYLLERRKIKEDVPELLKEINRAGKERALQIIKDSKLLRRQKQFAGKLAEAEDMTENALVAYAQKLMSLEDAYYRKIMAPTELISKLGPMLGLLGTLIPLGPGIVALGKGDIKTLSSSIGVGFDTTISGVLVAAICFSISYWRGHWYEGYISTNEAIAESLMEKIIGVPNKVVGLLDEQGMKKIYEKKS